MVTSNTGTEYAAARRRPRDRREQILRSAGELFAAAGFHAVRMEDIAEECGVSPRAIYRHFTNKQDVLSHVIRVDQDRLLAVLEDAEEGSRTADDALDGLLARLAERSLESLRLGPLWQREARHLASQDYRRVRDGTRLIGRTVRQALEAAHPDQRGFRAEMRAWIVVSIVTSPGHHDPSVPRRRLANLLRAACTAAIESPAIEVGGDPPSPPHPTSAAQQSRSRSARREQLIAASARAFRERGFGGVTLDDFGIAGPAVYRYFDSKADVLASVINRVQEWMALESARALRDSVSDGEVINGLVRGYVRVATEATDLLAVSVTEALYLPEGASERERRMKQDDLAEWVHWLRVARGDLAEPDAQTLVNAVRTLINDLVRIPHLAVESGFADELLTCALNVLLVTEVA